MNKASKRYQTKIEIPISIIIETIFSKDNQDVEILCRYAKECGFLDLENDYYKIQDDYKMQDYYVWLSKEERKRYDYETKLYNENQQLKKQLEENKLNHKQLKDLDKIETSFIKLKEENKELKTKIEMYEDPEDLTFMFMYCDEKAKDKIKELRKEIKIKDDVFKAENEELKRQLEEKSKIYVASHKYTSECEDKVITLENENEKLKKELEIRNELVAQGTLTEMKLRDENRRLRKEYQDTYKDVRIEIKEYKNQQKEFINYLEECIEAFDINNDPINSGACSGILSKYKEIIGGDTNE